jgi:flavin reductase (DIM6/NTAB) family NADH-FMN oxidoreductase RutF
MKEFLNKVYFMPQPVVIIGTYNEDGTPNAMNAAWAGQTDNNIISIALSKHKTTENLLKRKALTIAFATKDTMAESDFFGISTGAKTNKFDITKFHTKKADKIDAPIILEYPITLLCEVIDYKDEVLRCKVLSSLVDEKYIQNGVIDISKMKIICYDGINLKYREVGEVVGNAFNEGKKFLK